MAEPNTTRRIEVISEWVARIAYTAVFVVNMLCALMFVFAPGDYAGAYELSGEVGSAAIQGLGVAFVMWNVTYPLFILNPKKYKVLGAVVLAQQIVGLIGELYIYAFLPAGHSLLASNIIRFVYFDGAGVVLLAAAYVFLVLARKKAMKDNPPTA